MSSELKDKISLNNEDAEQAVLGALLIDWDAMSEVSTILRSDKFYNPRNQIIFNTLFTLFKQNVRGDIKSLINELRNRGELEKAGGIPYVSELIDKVPTSANIRYYCDGVNDMATRRELVKMTQEIKALSYDLNQNSHLILEEAERKIFSLSEKNDTSNIQSMRDVITSTVEIINARYSNNSELTGIPSGISKLDSMTSGFQKSELIIIGARPSIGKTAFALSMMEFIAVQKKIPCGFFSLEMSSQSIGQRLLAQVARIQSNKLRSGMLSTQDFQRLQVAAGDCYQAPLVIVDTPNMQLLELRSMARRMKSEKDVQVIFIDYIGLISTENPNAKVFEAQSEISKSLKALARELDIPIVCLCQVSRDAEGAEPNLAQLRGSGSIEQDADVVLFLHRDRKIMEDKEPVQDAKCIVAKQRNGATGEVEMVFFPHYTKFDNKVEGEEP